LTLLKLARERAHTERIAAGGRRTMEHEQATLTTADAPDRDAPDRMEALDTIHAPGLFDDLPCGPPEDAGHRRLLKRAVAALPRTAIAEMERRELIFAIRTAELPWLSGADGRLQFADRQTLERLAFLARRVCRRQLNRPCAPPASNGHAPTEGANGWARGPAVGCHAGLAAAHPLPGREKPR
jgi:hypothetical protein